MSTFFFFLCVVSKALYFQKGQNTRFRVQSHSRTRALWTTTTTRFGRRRRHMASSSSSRVVVVVFCADGANCRSLEIDRSMNIYEQRVGVVKQGWRVRISKIMHQKKKYLKKNEKRFKKTRCLFWLYDVIIIIIMSYSIIILSFFKIRAN